LRSHTATHLRRFGRELVERYGMLTVRARVRDRERDRECARNLRSHSPKPGEVGDADVDAAAAADVEAPEEAGET
jgi:hypothetical protein